MRKLIAILTSILWVLLIINSTASAKHIVRAECFFDQDPGQGNGLSMNGLFGDSTATVYLDAVSTASLSPGTHTLFVRMQDSEGYWGEVRGYPINIALPDPGEIVQAEYYVDNDPGQGSGWPLSGNFHNPQVSVSASNIPTSSLSLGTHTVFVRMKNSVGEWGEVQGTSLNISLPDQGDITAAEYFIDDDPGPGSGRPMEGNLHNPQVSVFASNVPTSNLSLGTHTVFVRMKNNTEEWGEVQGTSLNIGYDYEGVHLAAAEVFFDGNDPGAGHGLAMVALDGSFDEFVEDAIAEAVSTSTLEPGIHTAFVRMADNVNGWGDPVGNWFQVQDAEPQNAGNMIALDGNGDYIQVNDDPDLNPTAITVEAWIYVNNIGNYDGIITKGTESFESYALQILTNPNRIRFTANWPSSQNLDSDPIEANQWYHVAATFEAGEAKIFINGEEQHSATWSISSLSSSTGGMFAIGVNHPGGDEYFDGKLDEVRLWDHARNQGEIQADMHRSVSGTSPGLIAYYRMDEPLTWHWAYDAAGSHTGTLQNDAHFEASSAPVNISFTGFVTSASFRQPLVANLELRRGGNLIQQTTSGSDGRYAFDQVTSGTYTITATKEYYLTYTSPPLAYTQGAPVTHDISLIPTIEFGLQGDYYDSPGSGVSPTFGTFQYTRLDPNIDFNWSSTGPGAPIGTTDYQVRWQGHILVDQAGEYNFRFFFDDGLRFYLDNTLILDEWHDHMNGNVNVNYTFASAGWHPIMVEYYQNQGGGAFITMYWTPPGGQEAVVPNEHLNFIPGSISGWVTDQMTGLPIQGAEVAATSPWGYYEDPDGTDETGYYEITGVLAGTYTVSATAATYLIQVIENVIVIPDQNTIQNFSLQPGVYETNFEFGVNNYSFTNPAGVP